MNEANLVSLRAAARELQIDRATLARLVAERGIAAAAFRGGHAVFAYAELRRVVDLEWYGHIRPTTALCDECWGFIAHHHRGRPCAPGSYAEGQRLDAQWRTLSLAEQRRLLGGK
jgi:hypothetical protein